MMIERTRGTLGGWLKRYWQLVGPSAALVVAVAIVQYGGTADRQEIGDQSEEVYQAVCAFKMDLEERYEATAAYIRLVEQGFAEIPKGFTILALKDQQENRKRSLDSLTLECDNGGKP